MFSSEYCNIFKNIYFGDHLLAAASASWRILYKEFVDIRHENASFGILEDSLWLQLISFSTAIAFWLEISFSNALCGIYHSNQPLCGKFTTLHKLISIVLQLINQVKLSRKIVRCQGYFLKIALGTRLSFFVKRFSSSQNSFFVKHIVLIFSLVRTAFFAQAYCFNFQSIKMLSDFWNGILNLKNAKHLKKWPPRRWWNFCM